MATLPSPPTLEEVAQFLAQLHQKMRTDPDVIDFEGYGGAPDRPKNRQTLLTLGISSSKRIEYLYQLVPEDYYGGPYADTNNLPPPGEGPLWEFGKFVRNHKGKKKEVYIKVQLGALGSTPICISFHFPDDGRPLRYPYRPVSHS